MIEIMSGASTTQPQSFAAEVAPTSSTMLRANPLASNSKKVRVLLLVSTIASAVPGTKKMPRREAMSNNMRRQLAKRECSDTHADECMSFNRAISRATMSALAASVQETIRI
jgi:hypothetical protein